MENRFEDAKNNKMRYHLRLLSTLFEEKGLLKFNTNLEKSIVNNVEIKDADHNYTQDELRDFGNNLSQFQIMATQIYNSIIGAQGDRSKANSKILIFLKEKEIFNTLWHTVPEVVNVIDRVDSITSYADNISYIKSIFDSYGIDLPYESSKLVENFSRFQVSKYFKSVDREYNTKADFVFNHPVKFRTPILFEVKLQHDSEYKPKREEIYQLYEYLKNIDEQEKDNLTHAVFISYSHTMLDKFEAIKFKFDQLKKQLFHDDAITSRIHFIPANTNHIDDFNGRIFDLYGKFTALSVEKKFISKSSEESNVSFFNNDNVVGKGDYIFDLDNKKYSIEIVPQDTLFWRFGFVVNDYIYLTNNDKSKAPSTDSFNVHLCIGDRNNNNEWINSNYMSIAAFNEGRVIMNDRITSNYVGGKIRIVILPIDVGINVKVYNQDVCIGNKDYVIRNVRYVHFMAWCDGRPYNLNAKIESNSFLLNNK